MPQELAPEVYAALDLGSNSFHLQIARFENNKLIVLDAHKDMVRFAAGLGNNNELSAEARQRALGSLQKMAERLRGIPRDHIRIVGTNTLRTATNEVDADALRRTLRVAILCLCTSAAAAAANATTDCTLCTSSQEETVAPSLRERHGAKVA